MDNNVIITGENISKIYQNGKNESFPALDNVSIEIPRSKLTIIKGRSGSGKTTLINMLSGLDSPTSGTIRMNDVCINEMNINELEDYRRTHMGFVFQSVALFPIMSAYENVDFALRLADYKDNRDERIKED